MEARLPPGALRFNNIGVKPGLEYTGLRTFSRANNWHLPEEVSSPTLLLNTSTRLSTFSVSRTLAG